MFAMLLERECVIICVYYLKIQEFVSHSYVLWLLMFMRNTYTKRSARSAKRSQGKKLISLQAPAIYTRISYKRTPFTRTRRSCDVSSLSDCFGQFRTSHESSRRSTAIRKFSCRAIINGASKNIKTTTTEWNRLKEFTSIGILLPCHTGGLVSVSREKFYKLESRVREITLRQA